MTLLTCPHVDCAHLNEPGATQCAECGTWLLVPLVLIARLRERARTQQRIEAMFR